MPPPVLQPQGPPQPDPDKTLCVAGTYDGGIVGWELREAEGGGDGKLHMVRPWLIEAWWRIE